MSTQSQICVVLQATEAGGTISCHLEEIEEIVNETIDLSMENWDVSSGVCSITLPEGKNEQYAQALIEKLNSLENSHGAPIIDAEMGYAESTSHYQSSSFPAEILI